MTRLAGLTLCLLAFSTTARAQGAEGVDRTHGEEQQIRSRERWFREHRGLDGVSRPDLLRARAVEQTRARLAQLERDPHRAALSWAELGPSPMTMLSWQMGNVAGRVAALAVDPTAETTLYLGAASGGVWKTTDGGASWSPIFETVGTQSIGAIHLEPGSPQNVWVGTGEQGQSCTSYFGQGLFRSTDGGSSWTARNGSGAGALSLSYVSTIWTEPGNPAVVLAGGHGWCNAGSLATGGLFRSTDGGESWTRVLAGAVSDLVVHPTDPDLMYAAVGRWGQTGDGVYRSEDGGLTWTRLTAGLPVDGSIRRTRLALAPSNPAVIYAFAGNSSGGADVYRTTDGGTSWSLRKSGACDGQCSYNLCLSVHRTSPDTVYLGALRIYRSTDGGTSFSALTTTWGSSQKVHQDTHVLLPSPSTDNRLWVGCDGGIWKTEDGGSTFSNLNANLSLTQFYDIAVHPTDAQVLFGGSQDNSSERRFANSVWDVTVVTGDGFMNAVDPADPAVVFQTSYPSGGTPSVLRSSSNGAPNTFSWLAENGLVSGEPYPWVTPLAIADRDASTPTHLFLGSNHAYRADASQPTASFTWTKISPNLTGGTSALTVLTPSTAGGAVALYAGSSNGRIQRTLDALAASPSWTDVTGNYPGGNVSDVAVDPSDVDRVFVTRAAFGGQKLFRSTVGGTTWEAVGSGLPDVPANAVAVDPLWPHHLLVGTDVGVFESTDGGDTFLPSATGMPLGLVVTDLEIDDAPHVVTAGTYGRGAWQAELALPEGPLLAAGDATVGEGGTVAFTVTLSPAAGSPVDVDYATADVTASAGADYTPVSGTLTFATGETSKTVPVATLADALDEDDELLRLRLTNAVGATVVDSTGQGTIVDDDPTPSLAVGDLSLPEGDGGPTTFGFPVVLSAPSGRSVGLSYATSDGTATPGSAGGTNPAVLTIPTTANAPASLYPSTISVSGATGTVTKVVVVLHGLTHTYPDDLDILLSGPTGANLMIVSDVGGGEDVSSATLTLDDGAASALPDGGPLVTGTFRPTNVGSDGTAFPSGAPTPSTHATFAAAFQGTDPNGTWSLWVRDEYSTDGGSIAGWTLQVTTSGGDYTGTSGVLTLAPGQTAATIPVVVNGDTEVEADETFFLNLSGALNAGLPDPQALGTILDDDGVPPAGDPGTDFDGDGREDVFWRRGSSGEDAVWFMDGLAVGGGGLLPSVAGPWQVAGAGDLDGDGRADVLWRNGSTGENAAWLLNGATIAGGGVLTTVAPSWTVPGLGDFDGDGREDLLWRSAGGENAVWFMDGLTVASGALVAAMPEGWSARVGDLDGNGKADVLWFDASTGQTAAWSMDGAAVAGGALLPTVAAGWVPEQLADLDGDGRADVVWRGPAGENAVWFMNGLSVASGGYLPPVAAPWALAGAGDFDGDGRADLLWRHGGTGDNAVWLMDGASIAAGGLLTAVPDVAWDVALP